jgi:hypothetical protein
MQPFGVSDETPAAAFEDIENAWKSTAPRSAMRNGVNPRYSRPDGLEKLAADKLSRSQARAAAINAASPLFTAICSRHELTQFDTETGACLSCLSEIRGLPARQTYEAAHGDAYPAPCGEHGPAALARCSNGKCVLCYDAAGRKRKGRPGDPIRIAARASGASSYRSTCTVHGETDFHTIRGRCLDCFTSLGYPRKVPRA